ncbi:MAG: hypothetical protein M1824_005332 [Vezdaea acicularis]|nr:MAG: hypothetical protein M1824_005332 [Vezdaea acicularis]
MSGDTPKIWIKQHRTEIASSISSALSMTITYPMDTLKSRVQAYKSQKVMPVVRETFATEGIRGFWRASLAPLASYTLVRVLNFTTYQKAKYQCSAWLEPVAGVAPLVFVNTPGTLPNLSTVTCFGAAGAFSGACASFASCPFELIKQTSQISVLMAQKESNSVLTKVDDAIRRSYQGKNIFQTAKAIVRNQGLLGMYAGFRFHFARDVLGTSIYFMSYESAKQTIATIRGESATSPIPVLIAGGLSGILGMIIIYPFDTARIIFQRNRLSSLRGEPVIMPNLDYFKRRSYNGLGVSIARTIFINAIFFSTFERIKKEINGLEDE